MKILRTISALRETLSAWRTSHSGQRLAFVPTMGFLHAGHVSLIQKAKSSADAVVVSIFVNPTQFNDPADYAGYPANPAQDEELCEAQGVDFLFVPEKSEMYPEGRRELLIDIPGLTDRLEGKHRPGHLQGVLLICARLFAIVQPDLALFGRKDFQQLAIIRALVELLNLPVEIVGCETVREPDGLALSSRNVKLDAREREHALLIRRGLLIAEKEIRAGERSADTIREIVKDVIESGSRNTVDYISVATCDTLEELSLLGSGQRAVLSVAVFTGPVRLIDNLEVEVV